MKSFTKSSIVSLTASGFAISLLASGCSKANEGEDLQASPKQATGIVQSPATEVTDNRPGTAATNVAPVRTMDPVPEKAVTKTTAETQASAQDVPSKPQSLEEAIAAPGDKKITALSADGRKKVIPMGKVTLAETDTYLLKATIPNTVAVGKSEVVSITLTPKTGWKINQEFPTKLKIVAPGGASVTAPTQMAKDAKSFSEKKAEFKVKFSASSAGTKNFTGKFRFAMCTDATCDPKSADLAWTLIAK